MHFHLNIEDILNHQFIESERVEFKEGWNPDAIYRSIRAFANDFEIINYGARPIGKK